MDDIVFDIVANLNAKKEQIITKMFRAKFHADISVLSSFAPCDFVCKHYGESREEYYWCDKLFATLYTSMRVDGWKIKHDIEVLA